ncbi:hypothetical protein G9A89_003791 [Geosiphon pyriformis]|nr:hypothetical protein G9A89_003791 [Geosiphon pyriformis]
MNNTGFIRPYSSPKYEEDYDKVDLLYALQLSLEKAVDQGGDSYLALNFNDFFERYNYKPQEIFNRLSLPENRREYACILGCFQEFGIGTDVDKEAAFQQYKIASENDNPLAQAFLALCYFDGTGTKKDEKLAFYWCYKSAEAGCSRGQCTLGYCYKYAVGTEKDGQKAYEWWLKSAEGRSAIGAYNLGLEFKTGESIPQNPEKAFYWFLKSAQAGNTTGQCHLASSYEKGFGTPIDTAKAFYWYQKASEGGSESGQCSFGYYYEIGIGTKIDMRRAFYWYRRSARAGERVAQYNLSNCYLSGCGVPKNYPKAFYWYQKSAEAGDEDGQRMLGYCLESGFGTERDIHHAIHCYRLALKNHSQSAQGNNRKRSLIEDFDVSSIQNLPDQSESGHTPTGNSFPPKLLVQNENILKELTDIAFYAREAACLNKKADFLTESIYAKVFLKPHTTQSNEREIIVSFKANDISYKAFLKRKYFLTKRYPGSMNEDVLVDAEFMRQWENGRPAFWKILAPYTNQDGIFSVQYHSTFTGFSVGGAIAIIAALAVKKKYKLSPKVVTFGQPKIGNFEFAKLVAKNLDVFRVTHGDDFITRFPDKDTVHHEKEYWIPASTDQCECAPIEVSQTSISRFPQVFLCPADPKTLTPHPECNSRYHWTNNRWWGRLLPTDYHSGPYFGYTMVLQAGWKASLHLIQIANPAFL